MEITDIKVRKINTEGRMKAVVSVTFDDAFVVHDIKVIEGEKGVFIAMPSRKAADGEYRDGDNSTLFVSSWDTTDENNRMQYDENAGDFVKIYKNVAKGEEAKAREMLKRLYDYYYTHPEAIPADFQPQMSMEGMERTVCDYIAGMTDNYAVDKYTELFIPMGWHVRG